MYLPIMNASESIFHKIIFLNSVSSNKLTDFSQFLHFHPRLSFEVEELVTIIFVLFSSLSYLLL